MPRTVALALLLTAVCGLALAGCRGPMAKHQISAAETVEYPLGWQVTTERSPSGTARTVFSPDAPVGPRSTRVLLEVTAAEDVVLSPGGRAVNVVLDADLGERDGVRGFRYLVTRAPSLFVVEAYGAGRSFNRAKAVAEGMVKELKSRSESSNGQIIYGGRSWQWQVPRVPTGR